MPQAGFEPTSSWLLEWSLSEFWHKDSCFPRVEIRIYKNVQWSASFNFCHQVTTVLLHCATWQGLVHTLLLNEGIPRALEGKKLRLKIPRVLPSIFELFLVFQIWGQNTIGGQYLQKINALIFWYKYLQKINAMPSDF